MERLGKQPFGSAEASVIRNYLDMCLELPWKKLTRDRVDVAQAKAILDKDHYGLDKVKERILEFIAVRQLNPQSKGPSSASALPAWARPRVACPSPRP